jgi:SAM-dependent methyltransferase
MWPWSRIGRRRLFREELAHWERELSPRAQFPEAMRRRLDPALRRLEWPAWIEPHLETVRGRFQAPRPRVLEVGSGPLSTLAWGQEAGALDAVAADPLADAYRGLLDRHGIAFPLAPRAVEGEALDRAFDRGSFHLVYARNSLDHVRDVHRCFEAIASVLAPGGRLCVEGPSWEGMRQSYDGLHGFDFSARAGALRCTDRTGRERLDLASLPLRTVALEPRDSAPFRREEPPGWFLVAFERT